MLLSMLPSMLPSDGDVKHSSVQPLLQGLDVKKMLIFRALQLGDMLCAVPALRALRAAVPEARITLVGLPWAEQFATRFDMYIDEFIAFPGHAALPEQAVNEALIPAFYRTVREMRCDLAVQMHGSGQISNRIVQDFGATVNTGFAIHDGSEIDREQLARFLDYPQAAAEPLRLLQLAEFLGAPARGTHLEFPLTEHDQRELEESGLIAGLSSGDYICIHPGARHKDKCWPPQRFAKVADRLAQESGLRIVLTGSAKETDLAEAVASRMRSQAINTAAPISIGAMAALMSRSRLLVCNDTGVSHIAAGLKLPSVVIFSKADMRRWAPLDRDLHRCIQDPDGTRAEAVLQHARELLALA